MPSSINFKYWQETQHATSQNRRQARPLLFSVYLSDDVIWKLHRWAHMAAAALTELGALLYSPTCSSVAPTRASCVHAQMFPSGISRWCSVQCEGQSTPLHAQASGTFSGALVLFSQYIVIMREPLNPPWNIFSWGDALQAAFLMPCYLYTP